jgi:AcrR family transcriptional regulator
MAKTAYTQNRPTVGQLKRYSMKKRIVKTPNVRRDEILLSARKLIFTKGYEQMTIQDILNDLSIAKGTIYHYFESKQALLEAFIQQIQQETEKPFLPILNDPQKNAIEKLQGFFDVLDTLRSSNIEAVVKLARIWYRDDNTVVREKVNAAVIKHRAPLLNQIVRQGLAEGVFTSSYPDQSGEIILALLQAMGNTHIRLLFALEQELDEASGIEQIIATHSAYMDAVEHVLGAPANCLYRLDPPLVWAWVTMFKNAA